MNAIEVAPKTSGGWLPLAFLAIMGLAMLAYVILDGYDPGVGTVLGAAAERDKDAMVASIGPCRDTEEAWLVLSACILLVAFLPAHGLVLGALPLAALRWARECLGSCHAQP